MRHGKVVSLLAAVFLFVLSPAARAQQPSERTLDEIKAEAVKRAENGMYPLIGLDPADVREAFSKISSTDNDEWAAAFSAVADHYMAQGKSRNPAIPRRPTPILCVPGACILLDAGPCPLRLARNAPMAKRSKRFWLMRNLWIRPWK